MLEPLKITRSQVKRCINMRMDQALWVNINLVSGLKESICISMAKCMMDLGSTRKSMVMDVN